MLFPPTRTKYENVNKICISFSTLRGSLKIKQKLVFLWVKKCFVSSAKFVDLKKDISYLLYKWSQRIEC